MGSTGLEQVNHSGYPITGLPEQREEELRLGIGVKFDQRWSARIYAILRTHHVAAAAR